MSASVAVDLLHDVGGNAFLTSWLVVGGRPTLEIFDPHGDGLRGQAQLSIFWELGLGASQSLRICREEVRIDLQPFLPVALDVPDHERLLHGDLEVCASVKRRS